MPKPHEGESRQDFIARCMSDSNEQELRPDQDARFARCNGIFESERNVMLTHKALLEIIQQRQVRDSKKSEFGLGISTADRYVKTLESCVGHEICNRYACAKGSDWKSILTKASQSLVYSNEDMITHEKLLTSLTGWKETLGIGDSELDLPKNTLLVFTHTLTTPRKDRDGDRLRSEGARLDKKMLMLWQHIPTLPIGKMLAVLEQSEKRVRNLSCLIDMNELCHDAAVMIDNDMGRYSHGFRALAFNDLKEDYDPESGPNGYDITSFEIMEESLVSVPSNVDAETDEVVLSLVEGGKLTSDLMKARGKSIRAKRPVSVANKVTLKERIGDYERTIEAGTFNEVKALMEKIDEDKSRSGSNEKHELRSTREREDEKGCTCASKEAHEDASHKATTTDYPQVKTYKGRQPASNKHFDVDKEELVASKLEYEWTSRFLSVPVKELMVVRSHVPRIRMGSFLTGMKEHSVKWELHDTRNITYDGKEIPPQHEVIQLNSRLSDTFLVEGLRFYKCDDGTRLCVKTEETWGGMLVTCYAVNVEGEKYINNCWNWAIENNFLKGEAFSLTGDFLERKGIDWNGLFLEAKNLDPVKRAAQLLTNKGKEMPNRGLILMGPPGTGKTLSGRILMNQAKGTFIWVSARDFWRTGSIGGLCAAFDMGRELAPATIFIEDVDNWMDSRTVDILKTEMDGIEQSKGLLTILTTNFPEQLPKALIDRPGRFHDVLKFDLPTPAVRKQMLKYWLPGAPDIDVDDAVKKTEGYSGAHIYELAHFAKTINEENEGEELGASLKAALTKISEQRELINQSQLAGSNYRPRSTELAASKSYKVKTAVCPECGGAMEDGVCKECGYEPNKTVNNEEEHRQVSVDQAIGIIISNADKNERATLKRYLEVLDSVEASNEAGSQFRNLIAS